MHCTIDDISKVLGVDREAVIEAVETLVRMEVMDQIINGEIETVEEARMICLCVMDY